MVYLHRVTEVGKVVKVLLIQVLKVHKVLHIKVVLVMVVQVVRKGMMDQKDQKDRRDQKVSKDVRDIRVLLVHLLSVQVVPVEHLLKVHNRVEVIKVLLIQVLKDHKVQPSKEVMVTKVRQDRLNQQTDRKVQRVLKVPKVLKV